MMEEIEGLEDLLYEKEKEDALLKESTNEGWLEQNLTGAEYLINQGLQETSYEMENASEIQNEYKRKAEELGAMAEVSDAIREVHETPKKPENTDIRRSFDWQREI
jgi:hypothetical protein